MIYSWAHGPTRRSANGFGMGWCRHDIVECRQLFNRGLFAVRSQMGHQLVQLEDQRWIILFNLVQRLDR